MLGLFKQPTKAEAQATFERIVEQYGVELGEDRERAEVFSYFETRDPYRQRFWSDVYKTFNKRKYVKSGIFRFTRTREYHSMWDKHYDEEVTLKFQAYTVILTRKYTYGNTYGRKFHDYDYVEIRRNGGN